MPRVFRAMKQDSGKPLIGESSLTLGVRTAGDRGRLDIVPDVEGKVAPGTGGMSVSPSVRQLLDRLLPWVVDEKAEER